MSRYSYIEIILLADPDFASIKKILEKGETLGMHYLDENVVCSATLIAEKMITRLINFAPGDYANRPEILAKTKDACFSLLFGHREYCLNVKVYINNPRWYTGDPTETNIDFERYIRFTLDLFKEFTIIGLKAFDSEYHNTY